MDIRQAFAYNSLSGAISYSTREQRSATEVTSRIFAMADAHGQPIAGSEQDWQDEWLSSKRFVMLDLPLHFAASPVVHDQSKVLECMRASADSVEPIVVDLNKKRIGSLETRFYPPVIVVDGRHRHKGAMLNGRCTIRAWVGELAAQALKLINPEKHSLLDVQAAAESKTQRVVNSMEASMQVFASTPFPKLKKMKAIGGGPGASLGSGSGPSMAMKPTASPGRTMPALRAKKKRMAADHQSSGGYQGYGNATKTMSNKMKGASGSEMASRLKGSGYFGYRDATNTQRSKFKGGTKSEMYDKLQGAGAAVIKKIVTKYKMDCAAGYKPRMDAVAPPGMEHVVKGLKKHFGEDSASPFKIAWWMHDKKGKKA